MRENLTREPSMVSENIDGQPTILTRETSAGTKEKDWVFIDGFKEANIVVNGKVTA